MKGISVLQGLLQVLIFLTNIEKLKKFGLIALKYKWKPLQKHK
jgi:hypothetical protein